MPRPDKGTRQKLIDTAKLLILTAGYGAVSVDDICRKADVKKGSFYHYFPSKQDLALAALEEHFKQTIEPDIIRVFAANTSFSDQIDAFADSIIEKKKAELKEYGHICGCPIAAIGSEMAGHEEQEAISRRVEDVFARVREMLKASIKDAMDKGIIPKADVDEKSREIHDFLTGLKMMARIHNSLDGLERDLKPGMRRILGLESNDDSIKRQN